MMFCRCVLFMAALFRLAGALLDLTMVLENPIAAFNENVAIKCVSNNTYFNQTAFPFAVEADIGTGTNITQMHEYGSIEPESWPGRQIQLLDKAGPYKYGIFSCGISDPATGEEAKVVGVVMSKNALLFPSRLSVRATVNDSITLRAIQLRPQPVADVYWVHLFENRTPKKVGERRLAININDVQTSDAGPYVVFHHTRDNFRRVFLQGVTRVVVRGCKEGLYGSSCTLRCPACENGGVCDDVSGSCICPPGFMGELCEIPCGPNKFGAECQHNCSDVQVESGCKGKTFCLTDPYGCTCATGVRGILCTLDCNEGKYGEDCKLDCHCVGVKCDPYTGECPKGCSDGWTGVNCQAPCPNGTFGPGCMEKCGRCLGVTPCNRFTGDCPLTNATMWSVETVLNETSSNVTILCQTGFQPPLCKEPCAPGTWGSDCELKCHCGGSKPCDLVHGDCPTPLEGAERCQPGWRGTSCNRTCQAGFYGKNCAVECGRCYNDSSCDHVTGECWQYGGACEAGYSPTMCTDLCGPGWFGVNCSTPCNCANGSSCHPLSGECEGYCQPGWTGVDCWEPCSSGTYGLNCSYQCGNCLPVDGAVTCDPSFGHCEQGCSRSWSGRFCDQGILCAQNPCKNDGKCEQEGDIYRCVCKIGYTGSHCEDESPACDSVPCLNNATCVQDEANFTLFTCVCAGNFTGNVCSVAIVAEEEEEPSEKPTEPEAAEERGSDEMKYVIPAAVAFVTICLISALLYRKCRPKPQNEWESVSIRPKSPETVTPKVERHGTPAEDFGNREEQEESSTPRDQELSPVTISVPDESADPIQREITEEKEDTFSEQPRPLQSLFDKPQPIRKDGIAHVTPLHLSEQQAPPSDDESELDVTTTKSSDNLTLNERMSKIEEDSRAQDFLSVFSQANGVDREPVNKLAEPPKAPLDVCEKRVKLSRTSGEWKVNRPSTRVRLNSTALKRLSEISLHNFYTPSPRKSSVHPANSPIPENGVSAATLNRFSTQSAGGCALDGWDSNRRASNASAVVYGVTRRDSALMVTSSRNVDEEFEMESRRGSRVRKMSKVEA